MQGGELHQSTERRWWRRGRRRSPDRLFLEHLDLIERAARSAGKRSGFSPEDLDDFVQEVKLKLVDDDYAVLRRHRGDSKLSTFLVTVVHNLCRDYRNHLWGKYRPSAVAKRLGASAIVLERLLVRDGHDLETAIAMARQRYELAESAEELERLAAELPPRVGRHVVGEEVLEHRPAPGGGTEPEKRVEDAERAVAAERVEGVLSEALEALDPQDLLILRLHLGDGRTLATIARDLRLEQRPLYTRKDRALRQLRQHFAECGLTWEDVRGILGWREHELHSVLTADPEIDPENDRDSPSNPAETSPGPKP